MSDPTFSTLWEAVDYELLKLMNILKGAICVGEHTQDDEKETTLGLVYVALEKVEEAQQQLEALRQHHYATEKETEKPAAPPTQSDQPF